MTQNTLSWKAKLTLARKSEVIRFDRVRNASQWRVSSNPFKPKRRPQDSVQPPHC